LRRHDTQLKITKSFMDRKLTQCVLCHRKPTNVHFVNMSNMRGGKIV
jgi:hypothetical protein